MAIITARSVLDIKIPLINKLLYFAIFSLFLMSTAPKNFAEVCVALVLPRIEPAIRRNFFCALEEKVSQADLDGLFRHDLGFEMKYPTNERPETIKHSIINNSNNNLGQEYATKIIKEAMRTSIPVYYNIELSTLYTKDNGCSVILSFNAKDKQ